MRICRLTVMNERQNLRVARMTSTSEGPMMNTYRRDRSGIRRTGSDDGDLKMGKWGQQRKRPSRHRQVAGVATKGQKKGWSGGRGLSGWRSGDGREGGAGVGVETFLKLSS
jgi:hypothetical protein